GNKERHSRRMPSDNRLCDEEQKTQGIPERHDAAELTRKQLRSVRLSGSAKLLEDRVYERGDGEFGSDHEADAKNCDDIENGLHESLLYMRRRPPILTQEDVLTIL